MLHLRSALAALTLLSACSGDRSALRFAPPAPGPPQADAGQAPSVQDAASDAVGDAEPDAPETPPAAPAAPAPQPRPKIGSIGRVTWIYPRPSRKSEPIGSVRPGTAVTLRQPEPLQGDGCPRWYAVEPVGFVCHDAKATLELDKEPFKALASVLPDRSSPFPFGYAWSTGSPMYGLAPSTQQQARIERGWQPVHKLPRNRKPRSGHEELATDDPVSSLGAPPYFASGLEFPRMHGQRAGALRWEIPQGAMLSFASAFDLQGRTFLLSPDLSVVPADRMRLFRRSTFHGVQLGAGVQLPIAWIRKSPKPRFRRAPDGTLSPTGDTWPVRTHVALTGHKLQQGRDTYLETRDDGLFIRQSDATVVESPASLPFAVGPDEKWIDVSIDKGTLTLLVGTKAVFSTLASPGIGGAPPASAKTDEQLVKGSHTPMGIYRVTYKVRETTMTPEKTPFPEKSWIADVPYTLYFRMPFAIHGAYWHEDFGQPKSGGCVNLSPIDARTVFEWAEPPIPDEWTGVSGAPSIGQGTRIYIHR